MIISQKAQLISPSPTLAVDAKAKQMKSEGHDIIGFGAGEPDFDTPDHIKSAAIAAINQGLTKYTPVGGTKELKNAISDYFKKQLGISYAQDEIIVSTGAKQCLFNALYCLIDEGDKVLIPSPYWVSYTEMVKLCGGIPVLVPTIEDGFVLKADTLKNYIDKKTKVLMINSPNNPCGSVYSKQDLEQIAKLCIENNIFVISDEIYSELIYDDVEYASIASFENMLERTLIINGVSKTFAMTGWRIGFAAGPKQLIKAMENVQGHTTSNPNSIAQSASVAALTQKDNGVLSAMVNEFSKRRKYMVERINSMKYLSCRLPLGAFYVFVDISETFGKQCNGKTINNSTDFAQILLENFKVAVVPGIAFGADDFIRLSYATSMENIEKGLDRIEQYVLSLK
ncbi:pyridoxal phosphate-dependent aminotransferase [Tepidanaerobacter sp. GT38]|uniref:pyridoxal phosphate-dependent aminotransferase n=1 Tax=Tepidanaerobacter sp. GT38 TaxID=2722793 RepID=UPI001F3A2CDB|nr:pyridoxal phosphate-dependent aminotransferase [Tepidanaerobacter sp. GT38]MCG1012652.1 pyridoxal phosphate-dependent aminotransferase [Tepidanaerobacter sp. GT38]